MRKFALVSATLVLAFAGCSCGQGWRPNILPNLYNRLHGVSNVGAPCDAGCEAGHAPTAGCTTCGNNVSSNFGGYEGEVIEGYSSGVQIGNAPITYSSPAQTYASPEQVRPATNPNRP